MTAREYRDFKDRQIGINRKQAYGSDRAYFPYPNRQFSTEFGTPGTLIRESKEYSTRNYDNLQNMKELSKLLDSKTKIR